MRPDDEITSIGRLLASAAWEDDESTLVDDPSCVRLVAPPSEELEELDPEYVDLLA